MTKEELASVEVRQYDTGFSMWIKQPRHSGVRVILDASLFKETGEIFLSEPQKKGFTFGTMQFGNAIRFVVYE